MAAGNKSSAFAALRIKQEPIDTNGVDTAIPRPGRLTTFKVPRDLTLGGAGPLRTQRGSANKKVYVPNLNVARNKNLNVKTSKDSTVRGRGRTDRGNRSERGGRGRGNRGGLVQTTGLFSEGAGALQAKRASSGYFRSASSEADDTGGLRRPTLIKREGKVDTSVENQHMKEILGESDDEDFKDEKTDKEFVPIKLNEAKWTVPKNDRDTTIKKEIKSEEGYIPGSAPKPCNSALLKDAHALVPIEASNVLEMVSKHSAPDCCVYKPSSIHWVIAMYKHLWEGEAGEIIADKLSCVKVRHEIIPSDKYPACLEEFFSRSRPQLFLMQLPDSLPCQEANTADEPSPSTEKSDKTDPIIKNSTLNTLSEGQIGKMVRYRSGKFKLILGETSFDLGLGTESGFLQEVMSISTNREERSGNMVNLGPIQAKVEATPDWDFLLKNSS